MAVDSEAYDAAFAPEQVIRSAFHLRASGRDHETPDASVDESRRRIQRHFSLVLAHLNASADRSLDIALERLQSARGERWTSTELEAWGHTLAVRRELNIRRLRLYRSRGLFPQNERAAKHAVPIFVDDHDTACAVGHLMRESGWGAAVAAIQATNNFVYVADVSNGPLVDWVLVSGLTQEEAALIQPGYYAIFNNSSPGFDSLSTGGEILHDGLVYSNFRFIAGELNDLENFPVTPPPANQYALNNYASRVGKGVLSTGGRVYDTIFDNWIAFGARQDNEFGPYSIYSPNGPSGVIVSYDVATANPNVRFSGASIDSLRGTFNTSVNGQINMRSAIYSASTGAPAELAVLTIDSGPPTPGNPNLVKQDFAGFDPQAKLRVVTSVRLQGDAMFTSLFQSFQLVPEPATSVLGAMGWTSMLCLLSRRKQC
ncbi:hypothetical protein [Lacipirellula sp.]|uniref:hypothetical protein n=1 Tax=Lacipirellula sp. TaxID=2691419 RepID=UPI003D13E127